MKNTAKLEQRFLEAVDYAHNQFGVYLKLEAWAASIGLEPVTVERLRLHLQNKGIL